MSETKPKNMNELAAGIAMYESGEQELSIAQIKEVLALLSDYVAEYPLDMLHLLIKNAKKRS